MQTAATELSVAGDLEHDALRIELTNRSRQPVTVYEHSLPWVGLHSLLLLAVSADALGSPIEKTLPRSPSRRGRALAAASRSPRAFPGSAAHASSGT